jgi:hypothetical protein
VANQEAAAAALAGFTWPSSLELLLIVPLLALLAAIPLGRRAARLMPLMALVMPALALWLVADVWRTTARSSSCSAAGSRLWASPFAPTGSRPR